MTEVREDIYYHTMAGNLDDKAKRIIPHVRGSKVLDVGAADGVLSRRIEETAGVEEVWSCDLSPADDRVEQVGAQDVAQYYGEEFFDTVVLSSVLHEVWSAGSFVGINFNIEADDWDEQHKVCVDCMGDKAWYRAVESAYKALKPGGRLIIRDGVRPPQNTLIQVWLDEEMMRRAIWFTTDCPWMIGRDEDFKLQPLEDLDHSVPDHFVGYLSALNRPDLVAEFLFTATWGDSGWDKEVLERYCAVELSSMKSILQRLSPEAIKGYSYTQPGYRDRNKNKLMVMTNGKTWPATNCLITVDKPSRKKPYNHFTSDNLG